ncbi:hypothetical protein C467_01933 [Halorubrum hochstenium ATCC 700873]|uniref:Uncharacterized protein n=1 Tax=Halorubrum hochstenium ATCC 700873 TaxID=1227481 RepID=M0FM37_9EURY|nr:hypothetical protein C467_01933 [Halorubrum hochstenium ATCC 700873]
MEVVGAVDGHPLVGEALADRGVPLVEGVDVERVGAAVVIEVEPVHVLDERALLRDDVLQFLAEHVGVEQVGDPDPAPARLVLVGRTDAAAGRADRVAGVVVGLDLLLDAVEHAVIRHDDVRAAGDADVRVEPPLAQVVDLREQRLGVDDAAVSQDSDGPADRAARNQRELVLRAAFDDGVAGVVAALITDYDVRVPSPSVDERALALVAELGADDGECHTTCRFPAGGKTDYGL